MADDSLQQLKALTGQHVEALVGIGGGVGKPSVECVRKSARAVPGTVEFGTEGCIAGRVSVCFSYKRCEGLMYSMPEIIFSYSSHHGTWLRALAFSISCVFFCVAAIVC